MPSSKILLIDDDAEIGNLLKISLRPRDVFQALTQKEAVEYLNSHVPDAILLDISLPDGDGLSLCPKLVAQFPSIPVIMLTGSEEKSKLVFAFGSGADDYITKPFEVAEVASRIDARIRRASGTTETILEESGIRMHPGLYLCEIRNGKGWQSVSLSPTEFRILWVLIKNKQRILNEFEISRELGKNHSSVNSSDGIASHISRIRAKLGNSGKSLKTSYGNGYYFDSSSSTRSMPSLSITTR